MPSRLASLLTCLALALSGAVAACGGEDQQGGGGSPSQQPLPGTGEDTNPGVNSAQEAVDRCERAISASPQLEPDVQRELEKVCKEAAEGDEEAVRKATRKVCERTIEESVPSGPARDQALASCQQSTR